MWVCHWNGDQKPAPRPAVGLVEIRHGGAKARGRSRPLCSQGRSVPPIGANRKEREAVDDALWNWLGDPLPDVPLTLPQVNVPDGSTLLETTAVCDLSCCASEAHRRPVRLPF